LKDGSESLHGDLLVHRTGCLLVNK
jgi:hypothetical protein